ncbi:unnamed protein product [[Candida] boidinii]|nr:unnamed protein product [[Candida] boidinii]
MSFGGFFKNVPGIKLQDDTDTASAPILPTTTKNGQVLNTSAMNNSANNSESVTSLISNTFSGLNPFRSNDISLPLDQQTTSASTTSESIFHLSTFERMVVFVITLIGSFLCAFICFTLFPILSLKPRKFALIWTLGSILFITSFGILKGFRPYVTHLISVERLAFTISFFTSILLTLLFALVWKNTLVVIVCCVVQMIASLWYTVSYFPYGRQGLSLTTTVARSQVEGWINS